MSRPGKYTETIPGDLTHNVRVVLTLQPMCWGDDQWKPAMRVLDWFANIVYWSTWPDAPRKIHVKDKESAKKWLSARHELCEVIKIYRTREIKEAPPVTDEDLHVAMRVFKAEAMRAPAPCLEIEGEIVDPSILDPNSSP